MTRWTLALSGVVVLAGAVATAKPPVEHAVQGKERSPIEQVLYAPERPVAVEAAPQRPKSRDPIRSAWLQFSLPRLGLVPLVPPAIW